jgi:iron(II)-dependent oxidoreductase
MLHANRRRPASSVILAAGVIAGLSACATEQHTTQADRIPPGQLVLIPGGEFMMGRDGEGDCAPAHTVRIDSFYIDRYEVTNAEYYGFCQATDHPLPELWGMAEFHCGPEFPDHPVVGVSWRDANAYARWAGKRLPTEAEWECAARGGLVDMDYPNGPDLDPSLANYFIRDPAQREQYRGGTAPVGRYPPNGYDLHDMAGNVVEWVADWYDAESYRASPRANPTGPETGKFRVIRGGGWHSGPYCNRVYYRNALPPQWLDFNVGFRCAKDARGPD